MSEQGWQDAARAIGPMPLDSNLDCWRTLFRVNRPRIEDIAWALARIPRFNGHGDRVVSVAEHSLVVCDLFGPGASAVKLAALMHDCEEAYTGDMVKPYKDALPALGVFGRLLRNYLFAALGVAEPSFADARRIKQYDRASFAAEAWFLFPRERALEFVEAEAARGGPFDAEAVAKARGLIEGLPAEAAAEVFLVAYRQLREGT